MFVTDTRHRAAVPSALVCFRREESGQAVRSSARLDDGGGRLLACATCRHEATSHDARIEVSGGHEHTFANPHGFLFRIGCFSRATCVAAGPAIAEWSWFPPHTWQVAHCRTCGAHLGWLFRAEGSLFHGLILDRLIEIEERR